MKLSIIIINWNSADYLRNCLAGVDSNVRGISFEVIVVDNASYDGSDEMVKREFPHVRFIQSAENLGFARANNLGFKHSKGSALLFLNPDTVVIGDAIQSMVENLAALPEAGAVCCRVMNADGTVQTACLQAFPSILNRTLDAEPLRRIFPRSRLWGMEALFSNDSHPVPVEMAAGACLMVSRSVFEKIGKFSEEYFMYGEDADLCQKIKRAGLKTFYLPHASITHFGGQSTKHNSSSSRSILLMEESVGLYFEKFHSRGYAGLNRLARAAAAIGRLAVLGILRLLPAERAVQELRDGSFTKWMTILRWSLGTEKLPAADDVSSPNRAKAVAENRAS